MVHDPFADLGPEFSRTVDDSRMVDGATFVLEAPESIPALWGNDGKGVLWAEGEGFMLCGPQGVGKSTIAQQVVLRRLGLRTAPLLGLPVRPADGRVLLLGMDRPNQIARSLRRMVTDEDKEVLRERLVVWKGPLPFNVTKDARALADFAEAHGAVDVVADSYKDLAPGIVQDEIGSAINMAVQEIVARGMQWMGLHHQRKATGDNKRPSTLDDVYGSAWLTAGLGSVALLLAKPGSAAVELLHLKQPAEPVGPLELLHDHATGRTEVRNTEDDLLGLLLEKGSAGVTEREAAEYLFGVGDGDSNEDKNARKKAHRRLTDLVDGGCATYTAGERGGPGGGGRPARWVAK
jgi:hypothetical protein